MLGISQKTYYSLITSRRFGSNVQGIGRDVPLPMHPYGKSLYQALYYVGMYGLQSPRNMTVDLGDLFWSSAPGMYKKPCA